MTRLLQRVERGENCRKQSKRSTAKKELKE